MFPDAIDTTYKGPGPRGQRTSDPCHKWADLPERWECERENYINQDPLCHRLEEKWLGEAGEMIWQEERGMNKEWDNKKALTLLGKRSSL